MSHCMAPRDHHGIIAPALQTWASLSTSRRSLSIARFAHAGPLQFLAYHAHRMNKPFSNAVRYGLPLQGLLFDSSHGRTRQTHTSRLKAAHGPLGYSQGMGCFGAGEILYPRKSVPGAPKVRKAGQGERVISSSNPLDHGRVWIA